MSGLLGADKISEITEDLPGEWGVGQGAGEAGEDEGEQYNNQCPMPNAQCPILNNLCNFL